jgi:hypothetical protein
LRLPETVSAFPGKAFTRTPLITIKEIAMSKYHETHRVLSRLGARELTAQELNKVGGALRTGLCTFDPKTCAMDGDCSPPPGC